MSRHSFPVTATLFFLALACQDAIARDLTFEDRIRAQEAIERIYWGHRIWPPENRAPKPTLEEVLSASQIRARVIDYIRKSNALAAIWNRPITAEQLRAEMRRMAAESRAPDVLRELFGALGDEPFMIAETLARQMLADRLIREAYATDERVGNPDSRRVPFDAWWAHAAALAGEELEPVSGTIEAVEIGAAAACVADSWRDIPAGPAPFIGHTAVWTGTEMIIWGQYSTGYPATGGRYNPSTNNWTATSDVNAPVTRYAHKAVWTGREMIVWGGHLNGVAYPAGYLNDGGRYDPTTDSWRPTSALGAPGSRESHSAVWTGSEMIIWGGDTGQGTVNSGGRYDPASDTWVSTSEVGAAGTRAVHTAVWTGTEMIVWGGDTSSDGHLYEAVNTGGLYRPSTDTWIPTSLADAPSSRSRHTAVWTGSEMIVWGGGPLYTNTGGLYDPSRDTWTPTSMSGQVPQERESHSAVWTGKEMIIWGGHQGGQPFNDHGGRYDPALSTWPPMSRLGAPSARPGSTAVWTGSEMLVWAGFGGTSNGYSGRYCDSGCETLYRDFDDDGYGNLTEAISSCTPPAGYVENSDDCNDTNAQIHPGSVEVCNGVDDNCNGRVDDGLGTTTCGIGACQVTVTSCVGGILQACTPGPPAAEICNGVDDNCNGLIDDGLGPGTIEVRPNRTVLWPPNHRMVPVVVPVTFSPACPTACAAAPAVVLASLSSSEPDNTTGDGDGNTLNDVRDGLVGTADFAIQLRAERDSYGGGRTYDIAYSATDCYGVSVSGHASVFVPHDQGGVVDPIEVLLSPGDFGTVVQWTPVPAAITYHVIRGNVAELHEAGEVIDLGAVSCGQSNATNIEDGEDPDPGQAFFYLVEYIDETGPTGYGEVSAAKPREPSSGNCQ